MGVRDGFSEIPVFCEDDEGAELLSDSPHQAFVKVAWWRRVQGQVSGGGGEWVSLGIRGRGAESWQTQTSARARDTWHEGKSYATRAQHTCIVDIFFHRTFISSVKEHRRCSVRFPELVIDTHALLVGATVATREM